MITPFTGLQQNREGRRRGHPPRSGLVLVGCSPAASAREGIKQVSLGPAHCVFAFEYSFAHLVNDSPCTSFLSLFISTLPVASPPELH